MAGSVVNQWGFGTGRAVSNPMPSVAPLGIGLNAANSTGGGSGTPTAGNWLFAVIAWRQDAVTAGVLQYPSTVSVRDDVHNFWIPVSVVPPNTGILRTSVWMAPAARAPQFVFASPTAYQAAITVSILEVTADVPWYSVAAVATQFTNQGTSVTQSQSPASGLFSVGVIAWDNNTLTGTFTSSGWTAEQQVTATNASDHTGDITMAPYTATTTGSTMTLAFTRTGGAAAADFAEVLITVHGVTDAIAFPYPVQLENWPALVTEMACGQVLNQNYAFSTGISPWAALNGTVSASALFTFGNSAGSLVLTPDGVHTTPGVVSEEVTGAQPFTQYTLTAWVNVPGGAGNVLQLGFFWYTSGGSLISSSGGPAVTATGSLQQLTFSAVSPATTGRAQMLVQFNGASVPSVTTLLYLSYASLAIPGALGAVPDDQLSWIDISARNFTHDPVRIARSVQYENQTLEAGTLEISLANNDGAFTAGNQQSIYYPYAGQTDVPVRMRAVWPASVTPYAPLFSGFTDDVKIEVDQGTLFGYALVTASDCWSRLTAQMLTAAQQEFLADIAPGSAGGFWPCNVITAAATAAPNLAATTLPALSVVTSKFGSGGVSAAFGSTVIALPGDPGGTGWSQTTLTSSDATKGVSLILIPDSPSSLPVMANGVTVEFWVFISDAHASGITWNGVLAACIGAKGRVWTLTVGAPSGGSTGQILFTVYDKVTQAATTTTVDPGDNWGTTHFYSVTFTQTTWTIYDSGDVLHSGTANFAAVYNGFTFNGLNNVPWGGLAGNGFNGVLQDIALYPLSLPQTRILQQFFIAQSAAGGAAGETDYQRVPRVTGYGGFVPPLAMSCLNLPQLSLNINAPAPAGTADVDPVTGITDTIGQVVSSYLTNIAASTLAAMFVDGTGALVYRRRLEWYDRAAPQWILGERAPLALNAGSNFTTIANWQAQNGATLTLAIDTADTLPAQFAFAGLWHGNGSTANPQLEYIPAGTIPVTPGQQYQFLTWWLSPQGWATGVIASIQWKTVGGSTISATSSATTGLLANAAVFITVTGAAPAAAATANLFLQASGTPASSVQFYTGYAALTVYPGEAPYLRDVRLSDDRAQMFNSAVVTQTGTGEKTTFTGTDLNFSPTSGITVTAENAASVTQRGSVPYTATVYLANTAQSGSFVFSEGSIEDFASWIVQTLGTPVLRGDQVTLTPGSTWQDMVTALLAEIGDTAVLNRRPAGAPVVSQVLYLSSIQHEIDIADETAPWVTTYQVSPSPQASVLQCDSPVNGVLDGTSLLGW